MTRKIVKHSTKDMTKTIIIINVLTKTKKKKTIENSSFRWARMHGAFKRNSRRLERNIFLPHVSMFRDSWTTAFSHPDGEARVVVLSKVIYDAGAMWFICSACSIHAAANAQFVARLSERRKKIHAYETDVADQHLSLMTKLRCDFSLSCGYCIVLYCMYLRDDRPRDNRFFFLFLDFSCTSGKSFHSPRISV